MIPLPTDLVAPAGDELRARYADYRRRQARALVSMLPKEAIRPLYRRASKAEAPGAPGRREDEDPLERLLRFCEHLLPLPTFDVWERDVRRNPQAHLDDLEASPDAPTPASPATLEARRFGPRARPWTASLRGFRDRETWRGFIAFEEAGTGRVHRTSLIFCEPGPADLRERFLGFAPTTLEAFLRSALP
jgi:hypothetical protein